MQVSSQLVIAGAGGHAKVIIEAVRTHGRWIVAALTDPVIRGEVLGVPVVGTDEELPRLRQQGLAAGLVGVGSIRLPTLRVELFQRLREVGFVLPSVYHFRATVSPTAEVGEGTVVLAGAVINAQARVGRNVIVNTGAIIEHDCVIGDHVHVAPRSVVGGGAAIEARVHVGMGAIILQGRRVGEGTVIGAGAVVNRDLPPNTVCVGVPARPVRELADEPVDL
jgi:sugar O-acyltransferase (sialic acid O-acetyltransferase NeuD family)